MQVYPDTRMECLRFSLTVALQFSPVVSGQKQQCVCGVQINAHSPRLPVQLTSD